MSAVRRHLAELLLVAVALVWGATFVLVKEAVATYPTLPFLALRFGMATLLILPWGLAALRRERRRRPESYSLRGVLGGGGVMGLFLSGGYIFQTFGLEYTTASAAGFITGMFIVIVPVLELALFRRWVGWWSAVAVAIGFVGLFLLSGFNTGGDPFGDGLVFLCAVSFAAHILATARFARRHDPIALTTVQLGTVALLSGALALPAHGLGLLEGSLTLPTSGQVWEALLITSMLASVFGFLVQTYAQRHAPPTRTALILALEPVFAGVFGYLLAGEVLGLPGWVGAALILVAILLAELRPGRRRKWVSAEEGLARVAVAPASSPVVLEESSEQDAVAEGCAQPESASEREADCAGGQGESPRFTGFPSSSR